jgi:hypothetical protein
VTRQLFSKVISSNNSLMTFPSHENPARLLEANSLTRGLDKGG